MRSRAWRTGRPSSPTSSRTCRSRRPQASARCPGSRPSSAGRTGCTRRSCSARSASRRRASGTSRRPACPALVKTRRLGYDGKGQRRVEAIEPLAEGELAEELVPFDRELSIVGVRGRDGETRFWPVGENVHREGILHVTARPPGMRRRRRQRRSARRSSTPSATSASSPSSSSRSAGGCWRTSSRLGCTTPGTGRSTAPSRASSRTTCERSSACRSARPRRQVAP